MRTVVPCALSLLLVTFPAIRVISADDGKTRAVRGDVLAVVEKELARLAKQAEQEAGPHHPQPSIEVAFMLLTGLAAQGSQVKQPTAGDLRELGIDVRPSERERVQLITMAEDARVVIRAAVVQDKSGSWTSKSATLYRRPGEQWVECGSGSTAIDGVSLPK